MNPFRTSARHAQRRRPRRGLVLGGTAALVLSAGGVGYAAWSVTAVGSSAAVADAPVAGTVSTATPASKLYPGSSTPLHFTVTNPNDFPVTYTLASFGTVSVDDAAACPPADHVTTQDQTISVLVAPGETSTVVAPAGAITLRSTAPDGCQNRVFTVATTVTGLSS